MGQPSSRTRLAAGSALVAALASLILAGTAAARAPAIQVKPAGLSPVAGVQDDRLVTDPDPAARVRLLANAGASLIRVDLRWDLVAATRPANPRNPADRAYNWAQYDAIVAAARANGMEVLFAVYGTPEWARDPTVFLEPRWENWTARPLNAADFGAFGEAAAARYAPLGVHKWEAWNEPNISLFLRPQYERRGGRWAAVSPATYSALLGAFYPAVKRADPAAVVGGAVTAPAGERCPECPLDAPPLRVPPDDFVKALDDPALRPPMDVVSHHPYPITAPRNSTIPGRTYVDLYNLSVLIRAIDRTYLKGKHLWLTEYGFATRSTREYFLYFSPAVQGPYIADAYRRMKLNRRVALATYYLLQDHPAWASGLLDLRGRPKPGYEGHALPFTTMTGLSTVRRGAAVGLIGQARNASGRTYVLIQWRSGRRWVAIRRVRTSPDGSFRISLRPTEATTLRAQWTGPTRSGAKARRTSPPVTIGVR